MLRREKVVGQLETIDKIDARCAGREDGIENRSCGCMEKGLRKEEAGFVKRERTNKSNASKILPV